MKLWIDDVRPAPKGYRWSQSVNDAKRWVEWSENVYVHTVQTGRPSHYFDIELIDIDHDAGDWSFDGGDYIKFLDWLEETGRNYPIHIHSMNPVGVENMRRIIQKNGWTEIR